MQASGYYDKIKQELGDKSGVSSSLHTLGRLAQDTGDYDEARKLYQQSLEIKQELGDRNGIAFSFAQLALMEEKLGRIKIAVELTAKAEYIFNEISNPFLAERARNQRKRLESLL
jgi:tetratricopeptide (TPR) repeat protein